MSGVLLTLLVLAPSAARSQSLGLDPDRDLPVWMRSWSALGARADLPRRLPGAGTAVSSLFYGAPRVGTFWTAGNPAGLVDGVRDARTDFAGAWSRQQGDYRRPLDPGAAKLLQASAQSWKGFSPNFAMLGRVSFDQQRLDPGTRDDFVEAYPSSPFVSTDTSGTSARRTRAVVEGAVGWRLGRWSIGVTTGYEAQDHISILSTVTRRDRSVTPAAVLGVARKVGGIEVGGFGRIRRTAETARIFENGGNGRAYELTGYRDVPFIDLVNEYYKRREENTSSVGATLTGHSGRVTWTLYAERDRLGEQLTGQEVNNPAEDHWDESGWSAGGALQHPFGARGLVTLHARAVHLSGTGV
ncbi:MAG: DUF6850 family outer membrane beta-barrel protein, partial [Gemmatimonadota bacterium]